MLSFLQPPPDTLMIQRPAAAVLPRPEAVKGTLADELMDIMENKRLTTVFQPIIELTTGDVYAHEALCRIRGETRFESIEALFHAARQKNLTSRLEYCCRENAIAAMHEKAPGALVAINVCPSVLMMKAPGGGAPYLYEELAPDKEHIILELTERFPVSCYADFFETVEFYRKNGFRVALDDLGSGFNRLRLLTRTQPDLIKIDRFLISDIDRNTKKQMLVESIISFCRKIGARVVAEGVETRAELEAVMEMKADLAQGFYLGKPHSLFQGCDPAAKSAILAFQQRKDTAPPFPGGNEVGSLAIFMPPISPRHTVEDVIHRFHGDEKISALPVVEDRRPVGIIQKNKLFYKLGQPYGYALFSNKPVARIMDTPLVFEFHTPLESVAQKVLERNEKSVYDAVLVSKNGAYEGIVEIYQLLSGITAQKIQMAIQANPLTGLPGNHMIEREIIRRLGRNQIFAVLYLDIDNFKPFNDHFGFHQGDQVIRILADLTQTEVRRWDETGGFVGHVGGDDFVAVCRVGHVDCICRDIIRGFNQRTREFHDPETLERGYYVSMDRGGRKTRYPLVSVSIAVVSTENRRFASYGHLVSVAAEIKKKVKASAGGCYHKDQRRE